MISKVIHTPSAVQLQTFKNMTFFKMSKFDNLPDFECQNMILNVKVLYLASVRMPNMILNDKLRYSARFRISGYKFECQNTIFGKITNAKIGF